MSKSKAQLTDMIKMIMSDCEQLDGGAYPVIQALDVMTKAELREAQTAELLVLYPANDGSSPWYQTGIRVGTSGSYRDILYIQHHNLHRGEEVEEEIEVDLETENKELKIKVAELEAKLEAIKSLL